MDSSVRSVDALIFAAQVRLEEAAPFDVDGLLPKALLLSFFIDLYCEGVSVHHFAGKDLAALERRSMPPPEEEVISSTPSTVSFRTELSMPPSSGPTIEPLGFDGTPDEDRYNDHVYNLHQPRAKAGRLRTACWATQPRRGMRPRPMV